MSREIAAVAGAIHLLAMSLALLYVARARSHDDGAATISRASSMERRFRTRALVALLLGIGSLTSLVWIEWLCGVGG